MINITAEIKQLHLEAELEQLIREAKQEVQENSEELKQELAVLLQQCD